jgi:hypothetical protein
MSSQPVIRARNRLLIAAAVFLVLALAEGFPLSIVAGTHGLLWLGCVVGSGLFLAMAIREFAPIFLYQPIDPWFARQHTLLYLALVLPVCTTLAVVLSGKALATREGLAGWPMGHWLACAGLTLLWIVIIDWPSGYSKVDGSSQLSPPPSSDRDGSRKGFSVSSDQSSGGKSFESNGSQSTNSYRDR